MSVGSRSAAHKFKVADALFVYFLGNLADRIVPCRVVFKYGEHKNKHGVRIFLHKVAEHFNVLVLPHSAVFGALYRLGVGVVIVLPDSCYDDIGSIERKIPLGSLFIRRITQLIVAAHHSKQTVRRKIARAVQQRYAALRHIVNLGVEPSREHKRIRKVSVVRGVVAVVLWVILLPLVVNVLNVFSRRNAVAVDLEPKVVFVVRAGDLGVFVDDDTDKLHIIM